MNCKNSELVESDELFNPENDDGKTFASIKNFKVGTLKISIVWSEEVLLCPINEKFDWSVVLKIL